DLECFDDERIVRAIATCPIPIITGIGHQRDESLADLAADAIAHTPTAAAEMAVPDYQYLYRQHQLRSIDLIEAMRFRFQIESNRLEMLKHRLQAFPRTSRKLQQAQAECNLLREKLAVLDPKNVLSRGYAIARTHNGQLLRHSQDVMPGEEIIIELESGRLWVKIMDAE
ncbi:MAG: exodeoxyribonuclease VII large subunit, partial [Jaaginema sp. PMC 1079.18]|nr:exodeoxyribonuclease VII large subunit [Jaaginema sp. PMC 1079.18]